MQIISQTKKNILLHQQPLKTTTFTCFSNINEIKNQPFAKTQSAKTFTEQRNLLRRQRDSEESESESTKTEKRQWDHEKGEFESNSESTRTNEEAGDEKTESAAEWESATESGNEEAGERCRVRSGLLEFWKCPTFHAGIKYLYFFPRQRCQLEVCHVAVST